jgi:hypothetical protein
LDKAFEALTNAIKHAFRNDGEGSIDVRFQRTEAGWSLSVSDDGVGLSPVQPKAGLGTSLLEEFARQAGGTLSLEGGKGTMARLALPLSAAMSSADNDQNLAWPCTKPFARGRQTDRKAANWTAKALADAGPISERTGTAPYGQGRLSSHIVQMAPCIGCH